jgi:hypothetical protein
MPQGANHSTIDIRGMLRFHPDQGLFNRTPDAASLVEPRLENLNAVV